LELGITIIYERVRDFRQVGGFHRVLPAFFTNKTGCHDIAEILLKVALTTISQPHECLVYSFNTYLFIYIIYFILFSSPSFLWLVLGTVPFSK
jgi:hypothetical protein